MYRAPEYQLKFRAWDRERKKMRRVIAIFPSLTGEFKPIVKVEGTNKRGFASLPGWHNQCADFVLMQFTGYYDDHDKEIYECDVVHFRSIYHEHEDVGIIIRAENGFYIKGQRDSDVLLHPENTIFLRVIGNIFENPVYILRTLIYKEVK